MSLNADSAAAPARDDIGGPRQPILIVNGLRKHFRIGGPGARAVVSAVDDVSFEIRKNETLGVVGESGCGKSTTARLLMRLVAPDAGEVILDGLEVGAMRGISVRDFQRRVQLVFQDSYSSLNPRMSLEDTIAFGPQIAGLSRAAARARARSLLGRVGLPAESFARRRPHELSGGQRQRVNIARALAMQPRLLILDEAVSALDKSIQAQVLNLLQDLKREQELSYIFISHDLDVIRYMSDRVLVMYLGVVVEVGPAAQIYGAAKHPYTRALLASRPATDPRSRRENAPLAGEPPSPIAPPSGCRFRTRCELAEPICATRAPALAASGAMRDHRAACHACTPGSGHSAAGAPT